MFAGPEVFLRIKGLKKDDEAPQETGTMGDSFKIVYDTSAFTSRFNKAVAGEAVFSPDRPDIAQRVKDKRVELAKDKERKQQVRDPRIHQYPSDATDELIVERPPKRTDG